MNTPLDKEWEKVKKTLMAGLPPGKADALTSVLENTRRDMTPPFWKKWIKDAMWPVNHIKYRMKYLVGVKMGSAFSNIVLPIIRRVMPQVIANEIIGVQPMAAPAAQVFTLKYRYGSLEFDEMNIHARFRYELVKVFIPVLKRIKVLWALRYSKRYVLKQYRLLKKSGI